MNTDAYTLTDSLYVPVGGDGVQKSVDDFARTWVGGNYMIAFALIVFLTLIVIWMVVYGYCKEKFNPTQNLRDQDSDQFGLSASRENMDGARGKSAFAQQAQSSGGGEFVVDPAAKANQPGSLAWQVLHSADFNCDKRQIVDDDAWAWMNSVARENMQSAKPQTDNDFSRVLAGN